MRALSASSHGSRSPSVSATPDAMSATLRAGWKSSPSMKSQPSLLASARPTVVLPAPLTPMTMMIRGTLIDPPAGAGSASCLNCDP